MSTRRVSSADVVSTRSKATLAKAAQREGADGGAGYRPAMSRTPLVMLSLLSRLGSEGRLYRAMFLEELGRDYVRTARAKGLPEKKVMLKHVLRNAMIPILTNIGIALPGIFVGSFLLEVFFSIPGLGREIITAVNRSDFPVIKAVTVYLAILTMLINLLVDVMYKLVDPRVSFK